MVVSPRQSRKPDRPLASIIFSDKGKVHLVAETLPRNQKELELAVGKKFLGALKHFYGRRVTKLRPSSGRADLVCQDRDGSTLKIQVVEVVDPILVRLTSVRSSYLARISRDFDDVLALFKGCELTFIDRGNEPFLPPPSKARGKKCLRDLKSHLRELGVTLDSLHVGKLRSRKYILGRKKVEIRIWCRRFSPATNDSGCRIQWSGGRTFKPAERRHFVADAIRRKIRKHYTKPRERFWLLAYSLDVLCMADNPDVLEGSRVLDTLDHPFDATWYFYPYQNRELGQLVLVWSRGHSDNGR
jgi:hypothetical protein